MATRENISKLLQEIRGFAEVTNRRAPTGAAHALWAPVRPPVVQTFQPRWKLFISVPDAPSDASAVPINFR